MSDVVSAPSLREFFKVLLEQAIDARQVSLAEVTEFYVVNLLSEFAAADKLFTESTGGRKETEPLALLYHRAMQQEREERIRTLRRLGDVSLYKVGFFSDSLRDTPVGTDYYIEMGGAAYGCVASLAPASQFAPVYRELHQKFRAVVELLEEISARGLAANGPVGTLKVFESWVRTGSGQLERVLVDTGLLSPKGPLN